MFHNDLLIAFTVMGVVFLRQIFILKQPNKLNYAPLIVGIGIISSIIHFIVHTQNTNLLLLVRESLFPLLFAFVLYIIMNILHQTQRSQQAKSQEEFTKILLQQMDQLKHFLLDIESRMTESRQEFKKDIQALDTIQFNQGKLIDKFDTMENIYKDVSKSFDYFSEVKLPELDNIVHRHIDILRVAEQDHYKKLQVLLNDSLDNKFNIADDIHKFKVKLEELQTMGDGISQEIVEHTSKKISAMMKALENEVLMLKSHTSAINTSLSEGESILINVKNQSELIMKQMILSSKKMNELEEKTQELSFVYTKFNSVVDDIEGIKSDYVKSQSQLSNIVQNIEYTTAKELVNINEKIDETLEKIKHNETNNVNLLAKKAKLKNGYSSFKK